MINTCIIDLNGWVHRCYHAPMADLRSASGEPTWAVYTFWRTLARTIKSLDPGYLIAAEDPERHTLFRRGLYAPYKAHRDESAADLLIQLDRCRQILEALGVKVLRRDGYEADDLIAGVVRRWAPRAPGDVYVCSTDKDMCQVLSNSNRRVRLWDAWKEEALTAEDAERKWGVPCDRFRDYLALVGDSCDGIPGVRGVGPAKAAKLIGEYGGITGILESVDALTPALARNLQETDLRLMLKLTTLRTDRPRLVRRSELRFGGLDRGALAPIFEALGFRVYGGSRGD